MTDHLDRRTVLATMLAASAGLPPAWATDAERSDRFGAFTQRAAELDQLHAVVVMHRGRELVAEAIRGPAIDRPVNVKSVSKSLLALMIGIAIDEGLIEGTSATLAQVAPELVPPGSEPDVGEITVGDLLTMRAGLERTSGSNYGAFVQSQDWVRHVLSRPFTVEAGTRFQYSTGNYHVLGVILAEATGRDLLSLARDWLGEPLGVAFAPWTRDPQGRYLGGNNMVLSPRGMARIGEMVRLGGRIGEEQIVSAEWITASLTPRTRSPYSGDAYGYGWFLRDLGGMSTVYARGYGGQMIYIVPEAELTVAITSDPTRPARSDGHVGDLHDLVRAELIPALDR